MDKRLKEYLRSGGSLGSLANLPKGRKASTPFPCDPAKVYAKQVDGLALRLKRIGVKDVVVGVSGGLDSALALLVAVGAFRKLGLPLAGIHAYTMPGFGTSTRTKTNADLLCEGLGIKMETISIAKSVRQHLKDIGHDGKTPDVTYENAQARMRTLILMDKANMVGGIVLGTGDMSEIALGWCTYNGDHMSMFGVNSGVPKTVVRKVCAWWAQSIGKGKAAKALLDIVATPVSPELVKGQVTEDKIGPYELHDFFIWNFCRNGLGRSALYDAAAKRYGKTFGLDLVGRTLDTFLWRIVTQAFKRNCAPDGIRIFSFDFSKESWSIPSDMPAGWL
ncbi:MAG: NAD(+) synthase [Kiritimatiellae bacterium]|nr:NAD(+) synthase [Kiritimatiellia bacterium]